MKADSTPPPDGRGTEAFEVRRWVLDHEREMRAHPHLANATLDELVTEATGIVRQMRIAPKNIHRLRMRPPPTASDLEKIAQAKAKRARRGTR